eukprot:EG_transcript_20507
MKGVGKDLPLFVQPRGLKRFIFPAGKHFKLAQGVALCASPFAKISQSLNHVHRWQNPKWVPKILQLCNSANDTLKRLLTPWDTERRLAFVGAARGGWSAGVAAAEEDEREVRQVAVGSTT